ncbi:cytochrome P450 [Trichophaea hybrida]|nr:cytochrome P450 [Trichophaea hybrida]
MAVFQFQDIFQLPLWVLASLPIVFLVGRFLAHGIHNLYFHPLSKIPGPKLAAFTQHYFSCIYLSGRYHITVKDLHDKYGPIVRLSPTQVSFITAKSWRDIYGHANGRKLFTKSNFYDGDLSIPRSIISSRDPEEHAGMRKLLSGAFSVKALTEQEDLVQAHVDMLVKQIGVYATKEEGEDMVVWYNRAAWDIIGDLAFGDPFGSLKDAETHFWVAVMLDMTKAFAYFSMWVKYIGNSWWGRVLKRMLVPKRLVKNRKRHRQYSHDKLAKRLAMETTRKDFLTNIINEEDVKHETLDAHASILVTAGSGTIATFLSGVTYYLCRTPHAYKKLTEEIRSTFSSYNDITGQTAARCKYLGAVIEEGLRLYPPVPIGMGRLSPGEIVDGVFIPEGFEVFTSAWAASRSECNFHRPHDFLPERWLDKDCTDTLEASMPFHLGSRVCLGRNLAYLEMRLILAKIMWTYDMELKDNKLDYARDTEVYVMCVKPKLPIKFTRREGAEVPLFDDA